MEGFSGQFASLMLPMIMILTMLMGGFYLAIDSTAGERERSSLEPLLALPISRGQLVTGKYLAVLIFVFISGLLSTVSLFLTFTFMPVDGLKSLLDFSAQTIFFAFFIATPCSLLISSLLVSVAAYTKSTKEAQTYIGVIFLIPMVPFFLMQFLEFKSSTLLMTIPFVSQYKLIEKSVKSEDFPLEYLSFSAAGTIACAIILLLLAIHLYRQDRILS